MSSDRLCTMLRRVGLGVAFACVLAGAGCAGTLWPSPNSRAPGVPATPELARDGAVVSRSTLPDLRRFSGAAIVESVDETGCVIRIPATAAGIPVFEAVRVANPDRIALRDQSPGLNMRVVADHLDGAWRLVSAGPLNDDRLFNSWPFFTYAPVPHAHHNPLPASAWPSHYATYTPSATETPSPWLSLSASGTGTIDAVSNGAGEFDDGAFSGFWSLEIQVPGMLAGQPMRHVLTVWGDKYSRVVDSSGRSIGPDQVTSNSPVSLVVTVERRGPTLYARSLSSGEATDAGNW
jgi:hypothetical protein